MSDHSRTRSIFAGWWVVAACFLEMFVTIGVPFYELSIFMPSLEKEFGWSAAALSGIYSTLLVSYALALPAVGYLNDYLGAKQALLIGPLGMAVCFALVTGVSSVRTLYCIYAVIGALAGLSGYVPASALICKWFIRNRGLAVGVAVSGVAVGPLTTSVLLEWLIRTSGWRAAYFSVSAYCIALVPLLAYLLVDDPSDLGLQPYGHEDEAAEAGIAVDPTASSRSGFSVGAALHTRAFWLLTAATALWVSAESGVIAQMVPMMIEARYAPTVAALALGLTIGISAVGRIGFGFVSDHFDRRLGYMAAIICVAISMGALLEMHDSALWLVVFITLFGLGMGGYFVLPVTLLAEYFGQKSLGRLFAVLITASVVGGSIGPIAVGRVHDVTASYFGAYLLCLSLSILAAVVVVPVSKPVAALEDCGMSLATVCAEAAGTEHQGP